MNPLVKVLSFLFIALFLSGCDSNQYQIVTAQDGSLYRFNKKTGELSVVMEGKKVAKKRENSQPLDKPSDWKELRCPGKDLKVKLETVWRENKLCYRFSVMPYTSLARIFEKKKQDYVYSLMKPGFTVELVDNNGFMIKDIKINLWSMTKVPLKEGAGEELVMNAQIDCTKDSYMSIGGYNVKWQLDTDLIDDEKESYIKSAPIHNEKG